MCAHEGAAVWLSVPPVDQVLDLHGDPARHDLALFMHGNQWMAMEVLLHEFQNAHPEVRSVYYETLPPVTMVQQMQQGTLRLDDLTIHVPPDVLTAGSEMLARLASEGWVSEPYDYARNSLAILVAAGNPQHIQGWADLLAPDVRVVLPNPETEGITHLIQEAVTAALGAQAWAELTEGKRQRGLTSYTQIHHRETPLWLLANRADAGPVWLTEALYQQRIRVPLDVIRLPAEQNREGRYAAAVAVRTCRHPEAAQAFVGFLLGPEAGAVLADYGFEVENRELAPGVDHCWVPPSPEQSSGTR